MTERDPYGTAANQPGAKLDAGKTRAGLVLGGFARALLEVSAVGTFGAKKYTPHGWVSVPNGIERYTDAMHRHLLAEATGERLDADSGLAHAAHAAWCALARLDLMLREGHEQPAAVPYIGPDRRKAAEPAATVNDPLTVADAGGWIKWEGGECPVPYGTRIDVEYRSGARAMDIRALVRKLTGLTATHWEHINCSGDIVAYRLSKEASHAEEVRRAIAEIDAQDVSYIGPDRRACGNDLDDMVRAGKSVLPEDCGACGNVGREA